MNTYHLLSLCFFLLRAATAVSQSDTAASFAGFIQTQKDQPDSARFAHLNDFAYNMMDQLKFVDAEMAAAEMMELAMATKNETWKGRTFMTMANVAKVQLNTTQAVANYQQAQVTFHKNTLGF